MRVRVSGRARRRDTGRHSRIAFHVIAQPRCGLDATSIVAESDEDAAARRNAVGSMNTTESEGWAAGDERYSATAKAWPPLLWTQCTRGADPRKGERRQHGAIGDLELLEDVMKVHLDRAIRDIQPAPDCLVR